MTRPGLRPTTLLVGVFAGFMCGVAALTSQGTDLRPDRVSDLSVLIAQQADRNAEMQATVDALKAENEALTAADVPPDVVMPPDADLQSAGFMAVRGPAVRVTLTDAPGDFTPDGVSGDMLVVHEHDIQVVVNALWGAGAEAMTIQGQRVISTTAVKCVGNTIVLHGKPYAPPYVIEAIGDQQALTQGLENDRGVQIYRQYVQVYQLGYQMQLLDDVVMTAYSGPLPHVAQAER